MKEFLRCLSLPIQNKTLIVPYSVVAEVISFESPTPVANAPKWVLGELAWRESKIPLLYLEMMNESASTSSSPSTEFLATPHLRIVILNRISETAPNFVGIVLQNLPTMIRFKRADIELVSTCTTPSYLLMEVKVRNQPYFIPNIQWIEESMRNNV